MLAVVLPALSLATALAAAAPPARYEPNWDSLRDIPVPGWFDDAKFGILIHWGVYSVAGFSSGYNYAEHFPQFMYRTGDGSRNPAEHAAFLQQRFGAAPPDFGYKDLVPLFRAERFDPAAWTSLFRRAGARYVILTGEHHDGFALYDSACSDYDVMDASPYKRDIIKELSEACHKHGLKFGVYYSHAQDWSDPDSTTFFNNQRLQALHPDLPADRKPDVDAYIDRKALPQIKELMGKFDWEAVEEPPELRQVLALVDKAASRF